MTTQSTLIVRIAHPVIKVVKRKFTFTSTNDPQVVLDQILDEARQLWATAGNAGTYEFRYAAEYYMGDETWTPNTTKTGTYRWTLVQPSFKREDVPDRNLEG